LNLWAKAIPKKMAYSGKGLRRKHLSRSDVPFAGQPIFSDQPDWDGFSDILPSPKEIPRSYSIAHGPSAKPAAE
jgi:hypothetical protein